MAKTSLQSAVQYLDRAVYVSLTKRGACLWCQWLWGWPCRDRLVGRHQDEAVGLISWAAVKRSMRHPWGPWEEAERAPLEAGVSQLDRKLSGQDRIKKEISFSVQYSMVFKPEACMQARSTQSNLWMIYGYAVRHACMAGRHNSRVTHSGLDCMKRSQEAYGGTWSSSVLAALYCLVSRALFSAGTDCHCVIYAHIHCFPFCSH